MTEEEYTIRFKNLAKRTKIVFKYVEQTDDFKKHIKAQRLLFQITNEAQMLMVNYSIRKCTIPNFEKGGDVEGS